MRSVKEKNTKKFKRKQGEHFFFCKKLKKEFRGGTNTLSKFKQCKLLIQLSLEKRIPNHLSRYLLISLYRINTGSYADKINELLNNKRIKQTYVNRSC